MHTPCKAQSVVTEELIPLVYDELRRIAEIYRRRNCPNATLRPTELVHEACMHIIRNGQGGWKSPEHFRAIATRKIWQVIVDYLRTKQSLKHGGDGRRSSNGKKTHGAGDVSAARQWKRIPLDSIEVEWRDHNVDLLDLADALEAFESESRRHAEVVKLHWFGGLTYAETASCLGVSASTVEKDFRYALAWLNRKLALGPS